MKGPDVVFIVEYHCNGWVKKNRVNANLVLYDSPNFKYSINFAFRPRLKAVNHPANSSGLQ